jgi:hypothetical protein
MADSKKTHNNNMLEAFSSSGAWLDNMFLSRRILEHQLLAFQSQLDGLVAASRRREASIRECLDILTTSYTKAQAEPAAATETMTQTQQKLLAAHGRALADLTTIQVNTWQAQQQALSRLWPATATEQPQTTAPASSQASAFVENWWRTGWWPRQADEARSPQTPPQKKQAAQAPKKTTATAKKTSPTRLNGRATSKSSATATTAARRPATTTRRRTTARRVR